MARLDLPITDRTVILSDAPAALIQAELDALRAALRDWQLSTLCQECASNENRLWHTGHHCRWCGKPLVTKKDEAG